MTGETGKVTREESAYHLAQRLGLKPMGGGFWSHFTPVMALLDSAEVAYWQNRPTPARRDAKAAS